MAGSVPDPSPVVESLLKDGSPDETNDVMALIGFVGKGRNGDVRLYPDLDFQRWMDVPPDAIAGHHELDSDDIRLTGRTVVWVTHAWILGEVFKEDSLIDFQNDFTGSWMSTWPFIPKTRFVAAQVLGLVPRIPESPEQ